MPRPRAKTKKRAGLTQAGMNQVKQIMKDTGMRYEDAVRALERRNAELRNRARHR